MNYKSDVGTYTYSTTQPHAVTQAGSNSYGYDQNGNMTSRTVGGVVWYYTYDADGQLTAIRKNSQLISEYGYDGDGNRVWAKNYEGYLATNPKVTTYIGNYNEVQVEGYVQPIGCTPTQPCSQSYCAYFPYVSNTVTENISYYYADGQRIAMKNNGVVSYLYGDQLGSTSAIADVNGNLVSRTLYHPWGTTKYVSGTSPTDYAYTGQLQEGDIYFYNTRYYDPQLGRFMQADIIVPMASQGTQAFDRYAYVNNNPLRYTDPSGHGVGITNLMLLDGGGSGPQIPGPWYEVDGFYSFFGSGFVGSPLTGPISVSQEANINDPVALSSHPLHQVGSFLDILGSQLGMHIPIIENEVDKNVYWSLILSVQRKTIAVETFWIYSRIEGYSEYWSVDIVEYSDGVDPTSFRVLQLIDRVNPDSLNYCPYSLDYHGLLVLGDPHRIDLAVSVFCGSCLNRGPMWKTFSQRIK